MPQGQVPKRAPFFSLRPSRETTIRRSRALTQRRPIDLRRPSVILTSYFKGFHTTLLAAVLCFSPHGPTLPSCRPLCHALGAGPAIRSPSILWVLRRNRPTQQVIPQPCCKDRDRLRTWPMATFRFTTQQQASFSCHPQGCPAYWSRRAWPSSSVDVQQCSAVGW